MHFFTSRDWFNREPPFAFTLEHFLFIIIAMSVGVLLDILLRKKEKKTIKIVLISLWVFALVIETIYYASLYIRCGLGQISFNHRTMLPLHSCSMFMYIFPLAMFVNNKYIKTAANNFLIAVNMIMGFITLFVGCVNDNASVFSFNGMQTLIYHALIVIVPMIMVITNYYDVQIWDIKWGMILFLSLAFSMWIFDLIAKCDYFYIFDGTTFPVLKVISENVPAIVWTLITVSCYIITGVAMHFLIILIKHLINKKKDQASS